MPNYIPPRGPSPAKFMGVGEAPGADEDRLGEPFVGEAGQELGRMLHDAGLLESEFFLTNVVRFRPPNNELETYIEEAKSKGIAKGFTFHNGMWVAPIVLEHIEHLKAEILATNPNVIMAFGNFALWALTGKWGITKWRGSIMECELVRRPDGKPFKVIPTYHPAAILRQWSWRYVAVHDLRRAAVSGAVTAHHVRPVRYTIRPRYDVVRAAIRAQLNACLKGPHRLSVDIETRGGHIACLGFAWNDLEAICIPFMQIEYEAGYWTFEEEFSIIKLLKELFTHPNIRIIGQFFLYDAQYIIRWWGFFPRVFMDIIIAHHVCFPDLPKSLGFQSSLYSDYPLYWKDEGKEWDPRKDSEDQLWSYNCEDCTRAFENADVLERIVDVMNKRKPYEFQMSLFDPVLRMMLRGVKQDLEAKTEVAAEVGEAMEERLEYLKKILGHEINPRSHPQITALMYDDFKQETIYGKKGSRTGAEAALDTIAKREPLLKPICTAINEYRSLTTYKSTFAEALVSSDNRMRCSYSIAGANTFRFTSSKDAFDTGTNLQNLPSGGRGRYALHCKWNGSTSAEELMQGFKVSPKEFWPAIDKEDDAGLVSISGTGSNVIIHYRLLKPNIRKFFVPDEGLIISEWDLDRADLQVVVWEAEDEELKCMLREGVDIHSENAKLLQCPRPMAKVFVHGTDYGGSARTMAINCGLLIIVSDTMQRRWFGAHPGIKVWHRRTEEQLAIDRTVTNKFGYSITFFDDIKSILPKALAWTPQSTVAIVINHGLVNIDNNLREVELLLQVHDSLVMQHKPIPSLTEHIHKELLVPIPYPDPLTIPVDYKSSTVSWGDCS